MVYHCILAHAHTDTDTHTMPTSIEIQNSRWRRSVKDDDAIHAVLIIKAKM